MRAPSETEAHETAPGPATSPPELWIIPQWGPGVTSQANQGQDQRQGIQGLV